MNPVAYGQANGIFTSPLSQELLFMSDKSDNICGHPSLHMVTISGEGAGDFLNDILTAQIETLPEGVARAACLLSPQGRILFDMLALRLGPDHFGLVSEAQQTGPLTKKLTLYRLRRKLSITEDTTSCFGRIWRGVDRPDASWQQFDDERHPALGHLLKRSTSAILPDDKDWQKQRIELGIPQGSTDLTPNRALMLEAGLDKLNAVDFKKGCYVGQEVTARTHYRGLVKRRLFPVASQSHHLTSGDEICYKTQLGDEKLVGLCHSVIGTLTGSVALASIRLDAVAGLLDGTGSLHSAGEQLYFSVPDWMDPLPGFDKDTADS